MSKENRAYRSETNYIIAGVCGGLAEYFETDPLIIRVIFLILALIGAGGIILYIVLWALLPTKHQAHMENHEDKTPEHHNEAHPSFADEMHKKMARNHNHAHGILGVLLVLIGALFLFDSFYPGFVKFWPVVLIVIGLAILLKDHDRYDHHDHPHHR